MKTQKLTFKNRQGASLAARVDLPKHQQAGAFALFAHCFTCSKDHKLAVCLSNALTEQGFGVMRFDFTGLGESGGEFSETNFTSNVDDLYYAASFLADHFEAPKLLIGHSLGGTAAIKVAHKLTSITGVVTIGTPYDPAHVATHFDAQKIKSHGGAEISLLGGRSVEITPQFINDVQHSTIENELRNLDKAYLVMHSPRDTVVNIEHAARLFQTAKHPKSFFSLDNADHLLSKKEDAIYAGKIISVWIQKYI